MRIVISLHIYHNFYFCKHAIVKHEVKFILKTGLWTKSKVLMTQNLYTKFVLNYENESQTRPGKDRRNLGERSDVMPVYSSTQKVCHTTSEIPRSTYRRMAVLCDTRRTRQLVLQTVATSFVIWLLRSNPGLNKQDSTGCITGRLRLRMK